MLHNLGFYFVGVVTLSTMLLVLEPVGVLA